MNTHMNKSLISQTLDPEAKAVFEIAQYQREYTEVNREGEALIDGRTENDSRYFLDICRMMSNKI